MGGGALVSVGSLPPGRGLWPLLPLGAGPPKPSLAGLCKLRILEKFHRQPGSQRGPPSLPTALTHVAPSNPGLPRCLQTLPAPFHV